MDENKKENDNKTEAEVEINTETHPEAGPETNITDKTMVITKAEINSETNAEVNTEADVNAETPSEGNTEADVNAEPSSEGNTEADVNAKPPSEGNTEADVNAELPSEGNTKADVNAEPPSEGNTEADVNAKPPSEGNTEADVNAAPPSEGNTEAYTDTTYIPPRINRRKRILPILACILCFIVAVAAGVFFTSDSLSDKPVDSIKSKKSELLTAHNKTTIMIMGVDEREDDVGRSDTLMIATVDPKTNKATLLSIPRDTRVKIGNDFDKINAAYAYGGEKETRRVVENFLGISIDYTLVINTRSFVKIIDAIGGVDINVEKRMFYEDPWDDNGGLFIDLYPGMQHMDGKTAVTYVRYRDEEGDIGRVARQQKFMQACMDKVTSPSIITRLPAVVKEVMSSLKTDMSLRQLLELAGTISKSRSNGLKTEMVPGRPLYIDGISYWVPNIEETYRTMLPSLGLKMDDKLRSRIASRAQEYEASITGTVEEVPEDEIPQVLRDKKKETKNNIKKPAVSNKDAKQNDGKAVNNSTGKNNGTDVESNRPATTNNTTNNTSNVSRSSTEAAPSTEAPPAKETAPAAPTAKSSTASKAP